MATDAIGIVPGRKEDWSFVAGMCPAMQMLEGVIAEIAPTSIPVLLTGESGTGKEMFARRIHLLSTRSEETFVKIACASMNPATFSADLGLNTNANTAHAEENRVGTIFFDEISELDAACQRNLLHALPDGDFSSRPGLVEARVISTTNRNLDEEMREGRFRSELYYRMNGVCLRLPPLRDRKEDIPLLVEFFVTKYSLEFGRPRPSLSPRTLRMLLDHSWPGNIRELKNVVKKIVALSNEEFAMPEFALAQAKELRPEPTERRIYSLKAAARAASREAERQMILDALERTRWNRKRAAQELQISYKSLLYKLKQIGLPEA
jgi:two-component system response regulator AtoC